MVWLGGHDARVCIGVKLVIDGRCHEAILNCTHTLDKDSSKEQTSDQVAEENCNSISSNVVNGIYMEWHAPINQFRGRLHHGITPFATAIGKTLGMKLGP